MSGEIPKELMGSLGYEQRRRGDNNENESKKRLKKELVGRHSSSSLKIGEGNIHNKNVNVNTKTPDFAFDPKLSGQRKYSLFKKNSSGKVPVTSD